MTKEVKKEKRNSKEIVELSERQHVVLRPGMYVGQVAPQEEKMFLLQEDGKLKQQTVIHSIAFYKMFIEILDNSLDEAKRLKGKMNKIQVFFNSVTSEVKVVDFGEGFYKGTKINKETGLNMIETAVSKLRAGSNFYNEDTEESIIGTNGVGSAVVNMLSKRFTIESINSESWFFREWIDYIPSIFQPTDKRKELGTTVTFIPLTDVFKHDQRWNKQIIHTFMTFKQWLIKNIEKEISNLKFECFFDGEKLNLDSDFLPKDRIEIKTKIGVINIYETYDGSTSTSFINSAQCNGIHEKMINDFINEKIGNSLAHHHYECFTALNFPPKLVSFADQNKTKFATSRWDITDIMNKEVFRKIERGFFNSDMFDRIVKKIEEINKAQTIKNIKAAKKNSKVKFSDKYTPPSTSNSIIFLTEGNSAAGSVLQARDSNTEGVYSLKGKVKNCNTLSDLSNNKEVIDIMNILDLDVDSKKKPLFDKIVIATDADADGGHISSLLINIFVRWFPHIVEQGHLYSLVTPIISVDQGSKRKYFYLYEDFEKWSADNKYTNLRYLKGLGSLDADTGDWDYVLKTNRVYMKIYKDRSANRMLDIAFNSASHARKAWLKE